MTIKVLAIGDLTNNIVTLRKFVKKSQIHLINFPWHGPSEVMDEKENVEFFSSLKISKIIKKINEIKANFDICLTVSPTGALVAYLADLNYIIFFVGDDIKAPPFIKNVKDPYATNEPLYNFNFLERNFYRKIYQSAISWVVIDNELVPYQKKYLNDKIKISGYIMDTNIFNENVIPIEKKKTKFTFFSPQRLDAGKGIDVIWEALRLCKSDFELLQVEWFVKRTPKEEALAKKWLENKPPQVKLIPVMKRDEVARYYAFADAIMGQMSVGGIHGYVEREAALCKKPVLSYSDPNIKYEINGERFSSPFLPHSLDAKELAQIIDRLVEDRTFREKLAYEEYEFVNKLTNPKRISQWWDELFEEMIKQYGLIKKNSSFFKIKFRIMYYLLINRLYLKKFKSIF